MLHYDRAALRSRDTSGAICPPSAGYRFQKAFRRNKLAFTAASAVAAALILGLGISTWLFIQEKVAHQQTIAAELEQGRLRQQAEEQRQRAETGEAKAGRLLYVANMHLANSALPSRRARGGCCGVASQSTMAFRPY